MDKSDPANALANRVNQSLADNLVKMKLVSMELKEAAIPKVKEHLVRGEIKRASLLKILSWDMQEIEEKIVLDHLVEEHNLGYCNLLNYEIQRDRLPTFRISECWATMSLPIDFLEGLFFVTTTHYPSEEARKHWEKRLNREIIWMISDLSSMTMTLEKLEKVEAKELADAEEKRKLRKTRSPFGSGSRTPFPMDTDEEAPPEEFEQSKEALSAPSEVDEPPADKE